MPSKEKERGEETMIYVANILAEILKWIPLDEVAKEDIHKLK